MKKSIWIWNHYATDTFFDHGGRHYWMAKYLRELGYRVRVFCASTIHGSEEQVDIPSDIYLERKVDEIPYVFIKTPKYKGNGISRIRNMLAFYRNLTPVSQTIAKKYGKPDLILASSVHPLTCVAGIKRAKKYSIPCICEIRDLWPESIVAYTNHSKREPVIDLLYRLEHWIYCKADAVIFTFANGYRYIQERKWEDDVPSGKVFYLNTGVDLDVFKKNAESFTLLDKDLTSKDKYKIVYTGSIRKANNLLFIIKVAKILFRDNPNICFFLFGDGDEKEALERVAHEDGLSNVFFKGAIGKQYVPYVLSKADLLLVCGQPTELSMKYGESWNKLFEYAAAGKPVISNIKSQLIDDYAMGISFTEVTPEKFAEAIVDIQQSDPDTIKSIREGAERMARDYDAKNLARGIVDIDTIITKCMDD